MSKTSSFIGLRSRSRSIHLPDRFVRAVWLSGCVNTSVSKRPISLVEAALRSLARPPTTCRIVGSTESRSASFVSSYPASRLKIDRRISATIECRVFFPVRQSSSKPSPITVMPSTSSSSR